MKNSPSFAPDYEHIIELQLSNDAFFYLLNEDEPLDESNIEEAYEVMDMFPYGFIIKEGWKSVEDSDLIEAAFIPLAPVKSVIADYDEYFEATSNLWLCIKWLDATHIDAFWYTLNSGKHEIAGRFEVYTNNYGKRCFQTGDYTKGKGSLFFLDKFKRRSSSGTQATR